MPYPPPPLTESLNEIRQLAIGNSAAVTRTLPPQDGQYALNSKSTTRLRSPGTVKSAAPCHLPILNWGHTIGVGVTVGVGVGVGGGGQFLMTMGR